MQKNGVLGGRAGTDVLMQTLQGGKPIMINIPLPGDRGEYNR